MSKFLNLCEHIEKHLKEQGELPEFEDAAPGEPVQQPQAVLDPETDSEVKDVSNERIEQLIESIVEFYQKGKALSADAVEKINLLPSKINSENSEQTVEQLISIFQSSTFPEDTSETTQ
jgi:hypothetical protein